MYLHISSIQNPLIKEIKLLTQKKHRDGFGKFIIEGFKLIHDAIEFGAEIETILIDDKIKETHEVKKIIRFATQTKIILGFVTEKIIKELSDTVQPQGIIGIVKSKKSEIDEDSIENKTLFIMLENIQDPGNLGTIIRSCEAAKIDGLILLKGCVDLYNPKVIRGTMGAIFNLPIYFTDNSEGILHKLKKSGFKLFGTTIDAKKNYFDLDLTKKTVIIFGNESKGLSEEMIDRVDNLIKIPMLGKINSLNVSQSVGIVLYEALRQRLNNQNL